MTTQAEMITSSQSKSALSVIHYWLLQVLVLNYIWYIAGPCSQKRSCQNVQFLAILKNWSRSTCVQSNDCCSMFLTIATDLLAFTLNMSSFVCLWLPWRILCAQNYICCFFTKSDTGADKFAATPQSFRTSRRSHMTQKLVWTEVGFGVHRDDKLIFTCWSSLLAKSWPIWSFWRCSQNWSACTTTNTGLV